MNQRFVLKRIAGIVTVAIAAGAAAGVGQSGQQAMLARAKKLELLTKYVPPPGDSLAHHASGYAKILCSAVFITGLDAAFAAENVGYFTAPYVERAKLKYAVDHAAKAVNVTLPNGSVRTAKYFGDQGLHHAANRESTAGLHTQRCQEHAARSRDPTVADG